MKKKKKNIFAQPKNYFGFMIFLGDGEKQKIT